MKRKKNHVSGMRIAEVQLYSDASKAHLKKGDLIISINGNPVDEELDFYFWSSQEHLEFEIYRNNSIKKIGITRRPGSFLGIKLISSKIRHCGNKCIFCFIDQLPQGLRKSLYIKDEDYQLSFLNGNYITLTNCTQRTLKKIIEYMLSPLFISVHSTIPSIREKMLQNTKAGNIIEKLTKLSDHGIQFHTQIVVCPGINDGSSLCRTLNDLLKLGSCILSIAVVPVGLTRHRTTPLELFTKDSARSLCNTVKQISDIDAGVTNKRRIFLADEFFVKAQLPIPNLKYYEDFPQLENGVGLLRSLLQEWKLYKKRIRGRFLLHSLTIKKKHYRVICSQSAYPYINKIISEFISITQFPGLIKTQIIENTFFGDSVTVAGLLCARDIKFGLIKQNDDWDCVFLPEIIFNNNGVTLDGYSLKRIKKELNNKTVIICHAITDIFDYFFSLNRKT